jgi:hypothetical protein
MQLDASRAGGEEAGARGRRKERREKMIDGIMAKYLLGMDGMIPSLGTLTTV